MATKLENYRAYSKALHEGLKFVVEIRAGAVLGRSTATPVLFSGVPLPVGLGVS
jgi:hypothetical protein